MGRRASLNTQIVEASEQQRQKATEVPLRTAGNRKGGLHSHRLAKAIEGCKSVAWSEEPQFQLQHSDGTVRIWLKQHDSIHPAWY